MGSNKKKYILYFISILTLAAGYYLMGSNQPAAGDNFDESIFDFQRITLAPVFIIFAYFLIIISIFRDKWNSEEKK